MASSEKTEEKVDFENSKEALKGSWEKLLDEKTQRYYYINIDTKETTWDAPPDSEIAEALLPPRKKARTLADPQPGENPPFPGESGSAIGEVAPATLPELGEENLASASLPFGLPPITSKIDPRKVHSNGADQEQGGIAEGHPALTVPAFAVPDVNEVTSWRTAIDHDTGRQYHYNLHTRQTQWVSPAEMAPPLPTTGDYALHAQMAGRRRRRSMKEMQDAWDRGDRVGLWECPDCCKILTEGSKKTHPDSCNARKARSVHMVQGTPSDILAGAHWRAVQDQNGQTYYYHQITKQTSWFKPNEMQNFEQYQQNQAIIQNTLGTSSVGFNQWTEVTDSSGRVYYFNNITGATCWNKPSDNSEAGTAEFSSTMPSGEFGGGECAPTDSGEWIEVIDSNSGNKYYYNSVTKNTSWTNPAPAAGDSAAQPPPPDVKPPGVEPVMVGGETVDASPIDGIPPSIKRGASSDEGSGGTGASATAESRAELRTEAGGLAEKGGASSASEAGKETAFSGSGSSGGNRNDAQSIYAGDNSWREAIDQSSGRKYYYHTLTNETNWEMPQELIEAAAEQPTAGDHEEAQWKDGADKTPKADGAGAQPREPSWIKIFDEKSARFYYHNPATQETTWDVPEGFVESESNVVTVEGAKAAEAGPQERGDEEDAATEEAEG